jgi:Flp pilus assembly protein TadG
MIKSDRERGSVLLMVAIAVLALLLFLALVVDVGFGYVERRRVQAATDAAALAAARVLTENGTDAQILAAVNEYVLVQNPLGSNELSRTPTTQWLNGTTVVGTVGVGARPAGVTGVLVTTTGRVPTYFAKLMGVSQVSAVVRGGGGYSPLDAILVLDKSGSMDDDSCLLKGVTSPNPISLRYYFKADPDHPTAPTPCSGVSTGDGLSSSNCGNCGGRWSSNRCNWPDGTKMGSEVAAICGSVQTSQSLCTACKGVWKTPPGPLPINDLKTAADGFVDLAQAQLASSNVSTDPHMGLVSYSDSATLNVQLAANLANVTSAIAGISAAGYTNCEDGLYRARQELTTSGRQRWTAVKTIVFMSDGNANRCRGQSGSCSQAKQRAIAEAQLAGTQDIVVYTIGLGTEVDQDLLQQMVTPGGAYVFAPTSADLQAAYQTLFQKVKRLRLVN